MQTVTWNDKIGPRERKPVAIIITNEGIHKFNGSSITGVCHSVETEREKKGKWSNSTYRVLLAQGSVFLAWRQHFETGETWSFPSWEEALGWLNSQLGAVGTPVRQEAFRAFVGRHWPDTAKAWDAYAEALAAFGGI